MSQLPLTPELEVKVEADQIRREQLNSSANLVRVFASEFFTLHSPDVISYTHCGQVPHITADLCSSEVNGGSCKLIIFIRFGYFDDRRIQDRLC